MGKSRDHKLSSGLSLSVTKRLCFINCKEVDATVGIALPFKVPTSDIHDVKYDQGYQNKNGQ